ncbi:hypothetical protein HYY69_04465 [Candidatus Woesearchaeota archaeon]|nr:hypothetical protein [Candidatus Woesearchaeota archaeon]
MDATFKRLDITIISWLKCYGPRFLRYALAIIFIWFGLLKVIHLSPADELVTQTVYWFDPIWFVPFLGWWEVVIGLCLLFKPLNRLGLLLMAVQMAGTFLPLILLPEIVYQNNNPFALTIHGQYIVKNIVLIGAAMIVGSKVKDKTC